MADVVRLLNNPNQIINELFEDFKPKESWLNQLDKYFNDIFSDEFNLNKIPLLSQYSLPKIKNGDVIRFQGMIQDILEPEYYKESFEIVDANGITSLKPAVFGDNVSYLEDEEINYDSDNCKTGQRQVYCLVPIPGENVWVKEIKYGKDFTDSVSNKKREGSEDQNEVKRSKDDDDNHTNEEESKNMEIDNSSVNNEHNIFPWSDISNYPSKISCIIKYHNDLSLHLNDAVEVVGIFYKDYAPVEDIEESVDFKSTLIIYALYIKKLKHYNPNLPKEIDFSQYPSEWMREAREKFRYILETSLLGDGLASEFLLLHFISSVYHRQDMMPLGNFSLNLTGISKSLQKDGYTGFLVNSLSTIITHLNYFPMTLNNLNKLPFIPKKNYDLNRVSSGILQLPAHVHFILDETKLAAGQLNTSGTRNITALGNLVNWQKHDLDFKFYQLEQEINVPCLILSEGKSLVNCEHKLELKPINPTNNIISTISSTIKNLINENQEMIRNYLTVARLLPFTLEDDMKKIVEDFFVESRQKSNKVSVMDLHKLLIIARLVSVSCGETKLTMDTWKSAKILSEESFLRCNA